MVDRSDPCRDPIVATALRMHGLDPEMPEWTACENAAGEEIHCNAGPVLPAVHVLREGQASVRWWRPGGGIAYDIDEQGAIVTLESRDLPETVLAALSGMPLETIVEMPGAVGLVIGTAVRSRAFVSDPYSIRMTVAWSAAGSEPAAHPVT